MKSLGLQIVFNMICFFAYAQTNADTIHYFKIPFPKNGIFHSPDSLADGKWIAYCEENPSQQGLVMHYKNGKRAGECLTFWFNGKLRKRHFIIDGKIKGKTEKWYPNGNKQMENENFYVDKEPMLGCRKLNLWTIDGKQLMKNGTGVFISYYDNGAVFVKGDYLKGYLTGEWIWYYENGSVKIIAHFKKSVYDGPYKSYNVNGKPEGSGSYLKGRHNGEWQTWNDFGKLSNVANYNKGLYDGEYTERYANGNIKWKGKNKHDKRDGEWSFGNEDGTLFKKIKYQNGTIIN